MAQVRTGVIRGLVPGARCGHAGGAKSQRWYGAYGTQPSPVCNTPNPLRFSFAPRTGRVTVAVRAVALHHGIGSETERRPVVIAGRDPNKAMVCMSAPYEKPQQEVLSPVLGCFLLPHHRESQQKDLIPHASYRLSWKSARNLLCPQLRFCYVIHFAHTGDRYVCSASNTRHRRDQRNSSN